MRTVIMKAAKIGTMVGGLVVSSLSAGAGSPDAGISIGSGALTEEKEWSFTLASYLWAAGLEGETGQRPLVSDIALGIARTWQSPLVFH